MSKLISYQVACGTDLVSLEMSVDRCIRDGYVPYCELLFTPMQEGKHEGNDIVMTQRFYQAMVKYEKNN